MKFMEINGYDERYLISSTGKVWANPNHMHNGQWLKASLKKGYCFVCLCKDGTIKQYTIHRLVAEHFIPNPMLLPQVNHKDGNKLNNNISNLEWCTASHNKKHSWDIGTSWTTPAKRAASRRNAYHMLKLRGIV